MLKKAGNVEATIWAAKFMKNTSIMAVTHFEGSRGVNLAIATRRHRLDRSIISAAAAFRHFQPTALLQGF
jgi:hypothetical protein